MGGCAVTLIRRTGIILDDGSHLRHVTYHPATPGYPMSSIRVLGLAGLLSAACSCLGGFAHIPELVGLAGAIMIAGNLYALLHRDGSHTRGLQK
jgi:hypothetical protein